MALADYLTGDTAAILERWRRVTAPNRLVAAWLDIEPSVPRVELMRGINAVCGTAYPVRRLSDWLRGHAPVPRGAPAGRASVPPSTEVVPV